MTSDDTGMVAVDEQQMGERVKPLRMSAYYYSFDLTGVRDIDLILSAVACAGKAAHHTDDWREECRPYEWHTGANPIEWIQNAAKAAAESNAALIEQRDLLLKAAEAMAAEGWLYHGVEGMSEAQELLAAALKGNTK